MTRYPCSWRHRGHRRRSLLTLRSQLSPRSRPPRCSSRCSSPSHGTGPGHRDAVANRCRCCRRRCRPSRRRPTRRRTGSVWVALRRRAVLCARYSKGLVAPAAQAEPVECRRSSVLAVAGGAARAAGSRAARLEVARAVRRLGCTGRAFGRVRYRRRAAGRRIRHQGDPFSRSRLGAARAASLERHRCGGSLRCARAECRD